MFQQISVSRKHNLIILNQAGKLNVSKQGASYIGLSDQWREGPNYPKHTPTPDQVFL